MTNNISSIHFDILDENRKKLLHHLAPFTKDFILGGGTALALQLAHRKSFDFDFFTHSPLKKGLLEKLSSVIAIENVNVDTADELTFFTDSNIKLTFLFYPFHHHFPIREAELLRMFSVQELALHKAYTIGRRGTYRDYFDLFTILKTKSISLEEIIRLDKKIYHGAFNEKLFLEQLVYFDDITNFEIIPVENARIPSVEEVKSFFEDVTREYLEKK